MSEFKILSDLDHIRLRAPMYAGAITTQDMKVFLDGNFKTLPVNEAALKICSELLDNSLDEHVRTKGLYATKIDVHMDATTFRVTDNGRGIPIELLQQEDGSKIYRPVAAWTKARAGSNFNDADRVSIGANGIGSFLSVALSYNFIGHTDDGKQSLTVKAAKGVTTSVDLGKTKKHGTSVEIKPDLEFFGLTELSQVHIDLMEERLRALSIAFPTIKFTFNGSTVRVKKPEEYFNTMYSIKTSDTSWFGLSKSNGSFDTTSIVNGLIVPNGGTHIDWFVSNVMTELSQILKRRKKVDITPSKLRSYVNCYAVITGFPALKFDSQTKTKITNSATEIKGFIGDVDFTKIANALFKSEDLIGDILAYTKFQEELEAKKALEKLDKPKKKIQSDKLLDSVGKMKRLWLCEGLSAQAGLSPAFGRQGNAYFAMKGVPLSAWSTSHQEMSNNVELGLIYQIIKNASDDLEVIIASDQDSDGSHIRGILISFFKKYFPDLILQNKLKILQTPIAVSNDSKGLPIKWVYNFDDIGSLGGSVSYKKGLGSWTAKTLIPVIQSDGFENMVIPVGDVSSETLDNWFIDDMSDVRKELIQSAPPFNIMSL